MSIKKDILANYIGTAIVLIVPLLALPWYISLLGAENFGLISLAIMLQSLLSLLDAGTSQALVREFAVRFDRSRSGLESCAILLRGFEKIYWLFTIITGSLMILSTHWLARDWLHQASSNFEGRTIAIYGSIAMFITQFPGAIYRSVFTGTQQHLTLNKIISAGTIIRHLGAILLLLISPTIITFFAWHTLIICLETFLRFILAWRLLSPEKSNLIWDMSEVRKVWRSTLYLSLSVILGTLAMQSDKIILSHLVPVTDFGYYVIAATIATGLLQVVYPLIQTTFPIATQLAEKPDLLYKLYQKLFLAIFLMVVIGALIFFEIGETVLFLWLHSEYISQHVYFLLCILLIGTGLNIFYNIGYLNLLVKKKTSYILKINALSLASTLIFTPWLVHTYGTSGAAFGWVLNSCLGLLLSLQWVYSR